MEKESKPSGVSGLFDKLVKEIREDMISSKFCMICPKREECENHAVKCPNILFVSDAERRVIEKIEKICLDCHVKKSFTLNCNNCPLIKFKNEVLK